MIFEELKLNTKKMFDICNAKTVVIWGYGVSGDFVIHLFNRYNKKFEYIIDNKIPRPLTRYIDRSYYLLSKLNPNNSMILLTFNCDKAAEEELNQYGFQKNHNYYYVKDLLFGSSGNPNYAYVGTTTYLGWLEYRYGLDLIKPKMDNDRADQIDCAYYSNGADYSIVEIIDALQLCKEDAVFDYGCGKGGALILFEQFGNVGKIGGVEYDKNLYDICVNNFSQIDNSIPNSIINGDARDISDALDEYNYFYFYNPFYGDVFSKVIENIEESYFRKKRKIIIIYTNPTQDGSVIRHGVFTLSKVIECGFDTRHANIYTTP